MWRPRPPKDGSRGGTAYEAASHPVPTAALRRPVLRASTEGSFRVAPFGTPPPARDGPPGTRPAPLQARSRPGSRPRGPQSSYRAISAEPQTEQEAASFGSVVPQWRHSTYDTVRRPRGHTYRIKSGSRCIGVTHRARSVGDGPDHSHGSGTVRFRAARRRRIPGRQQGHSSSSPPLSTHAQASSSAACSKYSTSVLDTRSAIRDAHSRRGLSPTTAYRSTSSL